MANFQDIELGIEYWKRMTVRGRVIAVFLLLVVGSGFFLTALPSLLEGFDALEQRAGLVQGGLLGFLSIFGIWTWMVITSTAALVYLFMMIKTGFTMRDVRDNRSKIAGLKLDVEEIQRRLGIGPEDL